MDPEGWGFQAQDTSSLCSACRWEVDYPPPCAGDRVYYETRLARPGGRPRPQLGGFIHLMLEFGTLGFSDRRVENGLWGS